METKIGPLFTSRLTVPPSAGRPQNLGPRLFNPASRSGGPGGSASSSLYWPQQYPESLGPSGNSPILRRDLQVAATTTRAPRCIGLDSLYLPRHHGARCSPRNWYLCCRSRFHCRREIGPWRTQWKERPRSLVTQSIRPSQPLELEGPKFGPGPWTYPLLT